MSLKCHIRVLVNNVICDKDMFEITNEITARFVVNSTIVINIRTLI